ncbi:hypothetical protein U2F26_34990, partial [Micromonospora sp. 4G57]|nr:hypothetical protein [Micromonospora sp. 4G57]MDZ5494574.1 hypothetical protein [Micromonospora sp. 4G53]
SKPSARPRDISSRSPKVNIARTAEHPVPPNRQDQMLRPAEPAEFTDLAGLVDAAEQAGWTPVYAHVSDAAEWDDYEWSWIGSLTEWALDNPGHPDAAEALTVAREHRDQWLRGYRNVLGFVTLVLRRI